MKKVSAMVKSMPGTELTAFAHQANEKVGAVIIGGHFQGLGIVRSLAKHNIPIYLLDQELCIGRFSRYPKKFVRCPSVRQEVPFLNFLTDLAKKENIEGWIIYPNDDETVYFLAKYKEQLQEYYRIPTPPLDVVKFTHEKKLTYQLAEESGIAIPKTFYPGNLEALEQLDLEFPVIIKPSIKEPFYSKTRKKAIRIDDKEELVQEFERALSIIDGSQIMIQELIPGGPSYLFSVGSLYKDGEFLGKVVARRTRQHPMDFGHATTYAETMDIPELEEIAAKILGLIGFYGLSEVEFMLDPRDGRYKLIEINARPWGWHTLAIGAGVDLPYLLYQDMLGEEGLQNGFVKNTKWIRLTTDIPTVIAEIFRGRLKVTDYVNSLRGKKQFAVLSLRDPLPFIAELLMLPYMWKKRGF
ncbi:MAG: ATP-grasp domain-containing protein [Chloroflexi bacterium]|jgi:predicted ATP-grasp superfamily ATP-dependent carboligase|nr:ATP-grasp domain-containing protein [Chloroflexota bacterium]